VFVKGGRCVIRSGPSYYQKHRGLNILIRPHTPCTKHRSGLVQLFAYFDKVTKKISFRYSNCRWKIETLRFGIYSNRWWLSQLPIGTVIIGFGPIKKFPQGMGYLANYIASTAWAGHLDNVAFADSFRSQKQPQFSSGAKRKTLTRQLGWLCYGWKQSGDHFKKHHAGYHGLKHRLALFKLDALRHLKYEGYNRIRNILRTKSDRKWSL